MTLHLQLPQPACLQLVCSHSPSRHRSQEHRGRTRPSKHRIRPSSTPHCPLVMDTPVRKSKWLKKKKRDSSGCHYHLYIYSNVFCFFSSLSSCVMLLVVAVKWFLCYPVAGLPYYAGVPGVPSAFQYGPTVFVPPASAKQPAMGLANPSSQYHQQHQPSYGQHAYGTGRRPVLSHNLCFARVNSFLGVV